MRGKVHDDDDGDGRPIRSRRPRTAAPESADASLPLSSGQPGPALLPGDRVWPLASPQPHHRLRRRRRLRQSPTPFGGGVASNPAGAGVAAVLPRADDGGLLRRHRRLRRRRRLRQRQCRSRHRALSPASTAGSSGTILQSAFGRWRRIQRSRDASGGGGNMSDSLVMCCRSIITYRTYIHIDTSHIKTKTALNS